MKRDLLLLLGLGILLIAAGLGLRDPWPADEPLHALIARDMLATGNWLIPTVGGDLFQDKPPLLFWLQAFFYWLTGSERIGFLLPSLLAGLATLLLVYDLGRRLWHREAGMAAALVLLFTVQFTLQARRAQLDALLMFFTVLSLYCLMRQLLLGGGWRWAIAAGAAAGLGVLTKVVGFLSCFILLPWALALWWRWPSVRWHRPAAMWLAGALACVLVVAGWLLPVWLRAQDDPRIAAYLHELVVTHTIDRYADPWHHYHPPWYYLQVMATLWLPLVLLVPWLLPRWREALRARDARVLLPLGFVLLYVVFFSLSRGKRDIYILAALPMLALAAGPYMPGVLARAGVQRTVSALTALLALACLGLVAWFRWFDVQAGVDLLADGGLQGFGPLLALGLIAVAALVVTRWQRAHLGLAATLAAGWLIAGWWVFPQMDDSRSARAFIAQLEQVARPDRELGLLAYHEHFLWQLQRPSVNFGHRRFREQDAETHDAAAWLASGQGRQLLVPERLLQPCFGSAGLVRRVGNSSRGDWYLVEGSPEAACVAQGNAARAIHYRPHLATGAFTGRGLAPGRGVTSVMDDDGFLKSGNKLYRPVQGL